MTAPQSLRALVAELQRLSALATPTPWRTNGFTEDQTRAVLTDKHGCYVAVFYDPREQGAENLALVELLANSLPTLLTAIAKRDEMLERALAIVQIGPDRDRMIEKSWLADYAGLQREET